MSTAQPWQIVPPLERSWQQEPELEFTSGVPQAPPVEPGAQGGTPPFVAGSGHHPGGHAQLHEPPLPGLPPPMLPTPLLLGATQLLGLSSEQHSSAFGYVDQPESQGRKGASR